MKIKNEKVLRHSVVNFRMNTVIKRSEPDLMKIEIEKNRRAFNIGKRSGLFSVPKILDYDEARGEAVFERLDIEPVSRAVPWGVGRDSLAKKLGSALAVIHEQLILPEEMTIPLPDEFSFCHDEVFLHGDLSVDNVCVDATRQTLTIIDWQTTCHVGGAATYGTRYFDIFWFISNLINRPYARFLFSNPVAPVTEIFLKAYFQEAQLPYDPDKMKMYAEQFFAIEMERARREIVQNSKGRARLLLPRCRTIARNFIDSLKTI